MILSELISVGNKNENKYIRQSILDFNQNLNENRIFILPSTSFFEEISILKEELIAVDINSSDLVLLSEPESSILDEDEVSKFVLEYRETVITARNSGKKIVHVVTNNIWFGLLNEIIQTHNIPIYLTNSNYSYLIEKLKNIEFHIVDEFFQIKNLHHYSNDINNNLLIDLTNYTGQRNFYSQTIESIFNIVEEFEEVLILLNKDSFFPKINNEKIKVLYDENEVDLENYTYVLPLTDSPYDDTGFKRVMYYTANSKVVYTNYNFKLNNMIPSVILNLSKHLDIVKPLSKVDAFEILNENRNTVLYKYTTINLLENIYRSTLNQTFLEAISINETMEYFEDNLFLKKGNSDFQSSIKDYKYDIEQTLAFPIIFLGYESVQYMDSYLSTNKDNTSYFIIENAERETQNKISDYKVSMIIPIHNNGKYLKYKCYRSLKSLSRFHEIELIFIDDGSNDLETMRIINDIILNNNNIIYKKFENGSGSASRPRNEGVYLATTNLITYLDPDNETIDDGHSILLTKILEDSSIDMVVGDIIREDNEKRNEIRYSKKIKKAIGTDIIKDTRKTLIESNLTVQSIQGLIIKKDIILNNNISMIEGAAGQDTLYFQELLLNCQKVKVVEHMIHSYYAFVEGSVTNTVSHRFFEKFYKVELERIKFLKKENLLEFYMKVKFNSYFKNWYLLKYNQVPKYDSEKAYKYIRDIYNLYSIYKELIDEDIVQFIEKNNLYIKEI